MYAAVAEQADARDLNSKILEGINVKLTIKNAYKCSDGRWRAYCVDNLGKSYVVSYPRILMEQSLGNPLKPDEDVHHIDGNVDNNDISNLQIIKHGEHQKKHSLKYIDTVEVCQVCGNEFTMKGNKWARFYADLHRGRSRNLTCCKSCAGKISSSELLYKLEDRLIQVEKLWKIK